MDKTCRTVQEEVGAIFTLYLHICTYLPTHYYLNIYTCIYQVCSDPEDPEPQTECEVVMEQQCEDVVEEVRGVTCHDVVRCYVSRAAGVRDRGQDGVRGCGEGGLHHHAGAEVQPRHRDGGCHVYRVTCINTATCIMSLVSRV